MKKLYIAIGAIILLWNILVFSGVKILLSEFKVEPGSHYYIEEYSDIVESGQDSLVCKYFNGIKIVKKVFKYSFDNTSGIDSCPFILKN